MFGWFTKKKNKIGEPPIVETTDQSMKVVTPSQDSLEAASMAPGAKKNTKGEPKEIDWSKAGVRALKSEIKRLEQQLTSTKLHISIKPFDSNLSKKIANLKTILATTINNNKIMREKNNILAAKFLDDAAVLWKKKLAIKENNKLRNDAIKGNNKLRKDAINKLRKNTATDVMKEIDKHYPVLRRNLVRAYVINEYGAVEKDERYEEFKRFLTSVGYTILLDIHRPEEAAYARRIGANLSKEPSIYGGKLSEKNIGQDLVSQLLGVVNKKIEAENKEASLDGFDPDTIPENGHDFENWTADALSKFGWTANATQGSGDQGIDVIADKKDLRVGIQCKLYSGSVGNKAVQEVLAGITHFGLDRGVVITNAKYTKSAVALASSSNILLLSHSDIPYLESLLKK